MIRDLYSTLWRLLLGPAWLWWAWRTRSSGGPAERGRWRERLALQSVPPQACNGLLVHAASIGEGVAAVALLREVRKLAPDLPLLVTCTSFTGAQRLRQSLGEAVPQAFLPFDTPGAMARLLDRVQPRIIVLMETELWPNLLAEARARAIPVVLANARLSAKSARAYARLSVLSRPMLEGLHTVLAQSRTIARRFQALGVLPARLQVLGNLKSDVQIGPAAWKQSAAWRRELGDRLVCVAGSTHPGEDEALLAAWSQVLQTHPQALLVLVPRHPQRFDAVAQLIVQQGHTPVRRSAGAVPDATHAVWLGDTMGEMLSWFALADLAFIGGSLIERGGHSPLEAMVFGCPIVSGRHVHNFAEAYRALDRAGGVRWVDALDSTALANALVLLLNDKGQRQQIGHAGRQVFAASVGASERSARVIVDLARGPAGSVQRQDDGRTATWVDTSFTPALPERPFDAGTWQAMGAWQATVGGRGSAGFVAHGETGLVLRPYRRGGLVARWLHDRYLGRSAPHSRAMREFALLLRLREAGLDVPRPVAARMQRVGRILPFFYRADLLIERIPGAVSLAEQLARGHRPDATQWQQIGAAVRRLHEHGIEHVDLNAHNLLIAPDGRVWIIDFDRCGERGGEAWKAANLQRLQRSLHKLRAQDAGFAIVDVDWPELERGYRFGLRAM